MVSAKELQSPSELALHALSAKELQSPLELVLQSPLVLEVELVIQSPSALVKVLELA